MITIDDAIKTLNRLRHLRDAEEAIQFAIDVLREKQEKDLGAGLIHQVTSPLAESEPRLTCPNPPTCREACEDVDGLNYCLRCGLWEGCRKASLDKLEVAKCAAISTKTKTLKSLSEASGSATSEAK